MDETRRRLGPRAVLGIVAFLLVPLSPASVYVFSSVMGLLWLSTVPPTNAVVAQIFGVRYLSMLGGLDVGTRLEPLDRKLVVWICKIRACFSCARRLMIVAVGSPRGVGDLVEFATERLK